jgi:hypothetical protein
VALTVHEALSLKALERFKLVAGVGGLNNKISRVGLIDHESVGVLKEIIHPGEFLFSNMIMIKDQPDMMLDYIKAIIETKASCFALKTIFFEEFSDEVIEYANKHRFPLFIFNKTYIEDIILDIDQALNAHTQIAKLYGYIDDMLLHENDSLKVRSLALRLNSQFTSHFICARIQPLEDNWTESQIISSLNQVLGKASLAMTYEGSILLINSYEKHPVSQDAMSEYLLQSLENCGLKRGMYRIGLSHFKDSLGDMGRSILESGYALEYAELTKTSIQHFETLGIYQILLPNRENKWFHAYYHEIIEKLTRYDEQHDTELLKTAEVYIECDTNIQQTSSQLFQHVNTVRYRIRKIKELLNLDSYSGMMHETLAVAIHLYKMNTYT